MKSHRKNYVIIHCRSAKGYKMFQKHVHVWHHQRPFGLQYTMHWEFCTSSMVPCGLEDGLSIFKRWRPTFTHGDQPAVRGWRWTSHPHFSERLNHLHWLHVHFRYWNPPHFLTKPLNLHASLVKNLPLLGFGTASFGRAWTSTTTLGSYGTMLVYSVWLVVGPHHLPLVGNILLIMVNITNQWLLTIINHYIIIILTNNNGYDDG